MQKQNILKREFKKYYASGRISVDTLISSKDVEVKLFHAHRIIYLNNYQLRS